MSTLSANTATRRRSKKTLLLLSLAVGLACGTAGAQVIVSDPILEGTQAESNVTQGTQLAKQILGYEQQVQSYVTQLEQLRSILTKIVSLGSDISLTSKSMEPLDEAASDKLVSQACPGASSISGAITGVISGLLGNSSSQPITVRQQLICKQIVLLQIDEYNITATALSSLTVQKSTVQKLSELINAIKTMGESSSSISQAQQFMSQLSLASATWKAQIGADDAMISTLQQQQGVLSKVALNGSGDVLGNIVQAGTFAAALHD